MGEGKKSVSSHISGSGKENPQKYLRTAGKKKKDWMRCLKFDFINEFVETQVSFEGKNQLCQNWRLKEQDKFMTVTFVDDAP